MKPSQTAKSTERLDKLIPESVSEIERRVKVDRDADVAMWVIENQLGEAEQKIVHKIDKRIQTLIAVILKRIERAKR